MALLTNRTSNEIGTDDDATTVTRPTGTAQVDERLAERRRLEARAATAATVTQPKAAKAPTTEMVLPSPRPRASLMATLSLVVGLVAALTVLTGVLAGPGVGIGLLAAFAAIGGIAATSRRHVAGRMDAMLGLVLGLGAIVMGVLMLTGNISWLDTGTDQVMRVRDWLDTAVPWLFPNS
jgi:hypothetical protein